MTRGDSKFRSVLLWTGAAFLFIHAVLVFSAPASSAQAGAPSFVERLFPGVPALWVIARLAALGLGSLLLATGLDKNRATPDRCENDPLRSVAGLPAQTRIALGLAAAAALTAAIAAHSVPTSAGFLVLALPFLPALIVFGAERGWPLPTRRGRAMPMSAWIVIAVWFAWRVPAAVRSPRTASVVDTWPVFEWLSAALGNGTNPLADRTAAGVADGFIFLLGGPMLPADPPALLASTQIVHCLWIAVTAWAVARVASMWIRDDVAPVAAAAFLFSPMVLFMPYSPSPFGIFTAIGACAALALATLVRSGSPAAGLAFAALVGTAAMSAHLWLPVAALAAGGLWYLWRQRKRIRIFDSALAAACFTAAALPHLPRSSGVQDMVRRYVEARGQWGFLEQTVFGQRSPFGDGGLDGLWTSAAPQAFDIFTGGLLAPWAVARTPLRLWGDVLFDPLTTALAACALVLCIAGATTATVPRRIVVLALVVVLLPAALTSAYDVPSITRSILLPAPMAILAALGFAELAGFSASRRNTVVAAFAAAAIAMSGSFLFDGVNRRLLAASSLELAVESFRDALPAGSHAARERTQALLLDFQRPNVLPWLHTKTIVGALAPADIVVRGYEGRASIHAGIDEPIAAAYAWSPGLEEHERIADAFCQLWPTARIHRVFDAADSSSLFVAIPPGSGAAPRMSDRRSTPVGCAPGDSGEKRLNAARRDG